MLHYLSVKYTSTQGKVFFFWGGGPLRAEARMNDGWYATFFVAAAVVRTSLVLYYIHVVLLSSFTRASWRIPKSSDTVSCHKGQNVPQNPFGAVGVRSLSLYVSRDCTDWAHDVHPVFHTAAPELCVNIHCTYYYYTCTFVSYIILLGNYLGTGR